MTSCSSTSSSGGVALDGAACAIACRGRYINSRGIRREAFTACAMLLAVTVAGESPHQVVGNDEILVRIILCRLRRGIIPVDQRALHASTDAMADFGRHEGVAALATDNGQSAPDQALAQFRRDRHALDGDAILEVVVVVGLDARHLVLLHQLADLGEARLALGLLLLAAVQFGVPGGLVGGRPQRLGLLQAGPPALALRQALGAVLLLALVALRPGGLLFGHQAGLQ